MAKAIGLWEHLEYKRKRRLRNTPLCDCGYPLVSGRCGLCSESERRSKSRSREDIAHELVRNHGLFFGQEAIPIVNAIIDEMKDALLQGYRIDIRQFGVFEVRHYESLLIHSLDTAKFAYSRAKTKIFFKMNQHDKCCRGKTTKPVAKTGVVNRYHLAAAVDEQFNVGQKFSRRIINTFFAAIQDALLEENLPVHLYGFGRFVPFTRDTFMGFNMNKNEHEPIWTHTVIKFRPSASFCQQFGN